MISINQEIDVDVDVESRMSMHMQMHMQYDIIAEWEIFRPILPENREFIANGNIWNGNKTTARSSSYNGLIKH